MTMAGKEEANQKNICMGGRTHLVGTVIGMREGRSCGQVAPARSVGETDKEAY